MRLLNTSCPYCGHPQMPVPPKTARPFGQCPQCGKKSRAKISETKDGVQLVSYSKTARPNLSKDEVKKTYSIRLNQKDVEALQNKIALLTFSSNRIQLLYKT